MCDEKVTDLKLQLADIEYNKLDIQQQEIQVKKDRIRLHGEITELGMSDPVLAAKFRSRRADLERLSAGHRSALADLECTEAELLRDLKKHLEETIEDSPFGGVVGSLMDLIEHLADDSFDISKESVQRGFGLIDLDDLQDLFRDGGKFTAEDLTRVSKSFSGRKPSSGGGSEG